MLKIKAMQATEKFWSIKLKAWSASNSIWNYNVLQQLTGALFTHHNVIQVPRTKGSWGDKGGQTLQFSFRQKNLDAVRIVQHDPNSKENCPSHFQYFPFFLFLFENLNFIWNSKIPWHFPDILAKIQFSLTDYEIPWQFPDLEKF